tara:strand:+ start:156 stop:392 length:237 start_codon:yes stop_codon:yes gene_type:complete
MIRRWLVWPERTDLSLKLVFFASQAAEKALKGALLELGLEPPPHTHVLSDLVVAVAGLEPDGDQFLRSDRCIASFRIV